MCVSVRIRERQPGEIAPISAEQSHTYNDNEEDYAASHAIDLDLHTESYTDPGSDGTSWLKVKLDDTNCIHQVAIYHGIGFREANWICNSTDCSTCEGHRCSRYTLTVSSERTSSDDLPTELDCKYGDTVKMETVERGRMYVYELAVIAKQGEVKC